MRDQLISLLSSLGAGKQTSLGLPWVAGLVLAEPGRVANRSFLTSSWLIEIRSTASDAGLLADWQRVVDASLSPVSPVSPPIRSSNSPATFQEMQPIIMAPNDFD